MIQIGVVSVFSRRAALRNRQFCKAGVSISAPVIRDRIVARRVAQGKRKQTISSTKIINW